MMGRFHTSHQPAIPLSVRIVDRAAAGRTSSRTSGTRSTPHCSRILPSRPCPAATMIEHGIGHAVCRWAYTPDAGFVKAGDWAVLTTGVPISVPGTTNLITVRVVG